MFRAIVADSALSLSFHEADTPLATTKAFTHGRLIFDPQARTMTVATMSPFPIPVGLVLEPGREVKMRLLAPDGLVKPQTRSGVIIEGARGKLLIRGKLRTPSQRPPQDGWGYTARAYRAYLAHAGVPGTPSLPQWLADSVARQQQCWNRIVMHCRTALRECSDVPPEETRAFVTGTILPAIDAFNRTQGRGKKMRHPAYLKGEHLSPAAVRRFARKPEVREEQGKAVPENLKALLIAWVNQHVIDYAPMQKFERDLDRLIKLEADALHLRFWERRAVSNALLTTFTRRRRQRLPFTMGWPRLIAATDPRVGDWGIHYYLNSAKIQADAILNGGVRGLRLGQPLPPDQTGHPNARGKAFGTRRQFRPAEIAIPDRASGEVWRLAFCILQHQPIPERAFLKEWKLVQRRGKLQLILVLQAKSPLGPAQPAGRQLPVWTPDGAAMAPASVWLRSSIPFAKATRRSLLTWTAKLRTRPRVHRITCSWDHRGGGAARKRCGSGRFSWFPRHVRRLSPAA